MLPARETCSEDVNGVGVNPFSILFFLKNKLSRANPHVTDKRCSLPVQIFGNV